mgnify:CR=1 FL=1
MAEIGESFELTTHLGTGGFGETWLARVIDLELKEEWGEEVAIKIPRDKNKERALKKEIRLNGSLQLQLTLEESRNIVEYLDFETYKGKTVMVMKYVKGGNLRNKMGTIRYRKKMSLEEAIIVAKGVLNGLSVIHKKKILHRDIKPENILIDENIPKIADFGVGRMLKTGEFASTVTGTIFYMPPESLLCPKEKEDALVKGASFNSDIWSFGIMFYEMLCGKYPFGITEDLPLGNLINLILYPKNKLEFPDDANIPLGLQAIVSKSLERDPKSRYQTADDMLKDIDKFCKEEATEKENRIVESILNSLKDSEISEENLCQILNRFPNSTLIYLRLGEYYNKLGKYDKAIETLSTCLKNNPGDSKILLCVAMSFYKKRNFDLAVDALQKSIEVGLEPTLDVYAKSFLRTCQNLKNMS